MVLDTGYNTTCKSFIFSHYIEMHGYSTTLFIFVFRYDKITSIEFDVHYMKESVVIQSEGNSHGETLASQAFFVIIFGIHNWIGFVRVQFIHHFNERN